MLNYTLFATTNTDLHAFWDLSDHDKAISGLFDAWTYGAWGTLSQSATAGTSSSELYDPVRLDTKLTFSDQRALVTYRGGDLISGGLAWTRPVRLGGAQIQRDFALRPDLVTMPVPTLTGSAAVPATIDVFANNVRVFSWQVPSGPFEISDIPVVTGAGTTQLVVHDSLGRDTVTDVPFYASPTLLRGGLYDFSFETGFPRRYYGTLSNAYDDRPALVGTLRYGLTDSLTLETHGEVSSELVNAGVGAVFPLGHVGVVSLAGAASRSDRSGALLAASVELAWGPLALHARSQRVLGGYDRLASVTAPSGDGHLRLHAARDLDQAALSVALPSDPASLTLSFARLGYSDDEYRIFCIAVSRPIFERTSLFVSASKDFSNSGSGGLLYAGLSLPLGPAVSANTTASLHGEQRTAGIDVAKSETAEVGRLAVAGA
jgi:outer membrane usher protein